jgi:hypothetical protein
MGGIPASLINPRTFSNKAANKKPRCLTLLGSSLVMQLHWVAICHLTYWKAAQEHDGDINLKITNNEEILDGLICAFENLCLNKAIDKMNFLRTRSFNCLVCRVQRTLYTAESRLYMPEFNSDNPVEFQWASVDSWHFNALKWPSPHIQNSS